MRGIGRKSPRGGAITTRSAVITISQRSVTIIRNTSSTRCTESVIMLLRRVRGDVFRVSQSGHGNMEPAETQGGRKTARSRRVGNTPHGEDNSAARRPAYSAAMGDNDTCRRGQ